MTIPEPIPPLPDVEGESIEWHGQYADYRFTYMGGDEWGVRSKQHESYVGRLSRSGPLFDYEFTFGTLGASGVGLTRGEVHARFL